MSLLDRGPHQLSVQQRQIDRSSPHGLKYTPIGSPVVVRGAFQPVSASESNVDGLVALTQRRWISRTWPGDIHSIATATDGSTWKVVGDPQHYAMSPGTDHYEILLQKVTNA